LDERIEGLSNQIEDVAHQDPACEGLMTVPGIGPIILNVWIPPRERSAAILYRS